jgi:hypothetical protein
MSETNAIVAVQPTFNLQDTLKLGEVLARSKRFADDVSPEQAVVKVLAGQELGFGPIASMTGIYVIKGRVTVSANMMAQAVKRSTKYDYRIVQMDDTFCEIAFFEAGEELGLSVFTIDDARKAGTQNLDRFPRNMLFARAMSNGVKWYCPDVFSTGVYTPEELGVPVDGEGEIIDITPTTKEPEPFVFDPTYPDVDHWEELRQAAVKQLGYSHAVHVRNTLKKIFNGDSEKLTMEAAWAALIDHQQAKGDDNVKATGDDLPPGLL